MTAAPALPHAADDQGDDQVPPFPVLQVRIAFDGESATLNGRPVAADGFPDLFSAVRAAAGAAAADLGRAVRLDVTTPTGRVRHLVAHPEPAAVTPSTPDPLPRPAHHGGLMTASPVTLARPASGTTRAAALGPLPRERPGGVPVADGSAAGAVPSPEPDTSTSRGNGVPSRQGRTAIDQPQRPEPTPTRPPPATSARAPLAPAGLLPRLRPVASRPTVGWQARIHTWTRGRVSPPPSAAERRHRDLVTAVQTPLTGPRLVAVINPKGGAGKTPAVLAAAATWGAHRGSVIAWDDNETRGTLAMRALADPRQPTVRGLLADLPRFQTPHARLGDLAPYLRPQGDARFDVLASDDDPTRMEQFGAEQFAHVRDVLARFYALIVVDTGNNVQAGNWQAAVDAADQLLLVSTYQRDAAVTASWTLDHLHATGRGHLADAAVTVLSAATPTTDRRTRTEFRDHFSARTRAVIEIPYDPVIADGEHLDLAALRPSTRSAWLQATAALSTGSC